MKTPKTSKATQATQCLTIGNATIYRGDSVQLLQQLGLQVDALVTDPPYSSGGMVRGDRMQSTAAKYVKSGHALTAAHNLNFSGDNRDGRSWAFWVSCWVSLVRQARAHQMTPSALSTFYLDRQHARTGLVLGYGNTSASQFAPAIRTLQRLIAPLRRGQG